jgi:MFS family permease
MFMLTWYRDLTKRERQTMFGCFGGWTLDAFDVQVQTFVMPTLIATWGISNTEVGLIGTANFYAAAFGGWFAGTLSDRFGRVQMLQFMILWYAFFTFLCGWTQNAPQLVICRALQGFGFGGEWTAASVLMGEVIRGEYRGRAVGLVQSGWAVGWGAAAILYAILYSVMPEEYAWRTLFWIGLTPALLVFWIRRHIQESDIFISNRQQAAKVGFGHLFSMLAREHRVITLKLLLLQTGMGGGSLAFQIYLPTYLKVTRGMSVVNTGANAFVLILGSFLGFICGGYLADAIGRKMTFMASAIGSLVFVVIYMTAPVGNTALLILGFPLGFFAYTMFSPMGPYMTELFPTAIRATAQGFCRNISRIAAAVFPLAVGVLSTRMQLGYAIGLVSFTGYALMIGAVLLLPETAGSELDQPAASPLVGQGREAATGN